MRHHGGLCSPQTPVVPWEASTWGDYIMRMVLRPGHARSPNSAPHTFSQPRQRSDFQLLPPTHPSRSHGGAQASNWLAKELQPLLDGAMRGKPKGADMRPLLTSCFEQVGKKGWNHERMLCTDIEPQPVRLGGCGAPNYAALSHAAHKPTKVALQTMKRVLYG